MRRLVRRSIETRPGRSCSWVYADGSRVDGGGLFSGSGSSMGAVSFLATGVGGRDDGHLHLLAYLHACMGGLRDEQNARFPSASAFLYILPLFTLGASSAFSSLEMS